ncbi:YdcF family protein [Alcaligenaceae bacterium 429]|uniref:YdcF family protein n=1 Tax=Paenalcaligenes sp. Me52 TaxID=3392038 RepID=UPI0010923E22|nr:YdcF family protein [Alcaligenaceae bacterium 429]
MNLTSWLPQLVIPINLAGALVVIALLFFLIRWRKLAALLTLTAVAWVVGWSLPGVTLWAGGYLEQRYPHQALEKIPDAQAIIVLGGHTANNRKNWFEELDTNNTLSRVDYAAALYAAGKAPQIIVSGAAFDGGMSEAQMMARSLEQLHVPSNKILLERESQNTRENALFSINKLRTNGITKVLLVTSSLHMPRSMATFENRGIEVIPAPVAPQILLPEHSDVDLWIPSWRTLHASRSIIKEYVGLIVYWTRGWI